MNYASKGHAATWQYVQRCFCSSRQVRCLNAQGKPALELQHRIGCSNVLPRTRGVKTKTTIRVEDLPQGMLPRNEVLEPLPPEPVATYPTVIQQARNNMNKFANCVVLTRVGGFYELYFEQAEKYGPLLSLKVGKKSTSAGPVPMSGFPFFQLDRFLRMLIQDLDQSVAIAEEFPNNSIEKTKNGGLLFDRKVARVVTPGTLVDEKFMNPIENNFLLAVHIPRPSHLSTLTSEMDSENVSSREATLPSNCHLGLAWIDLSTGELFTQDATLAMLPSAIARIAAKETIVETGVAENDYKTIVHATSTGPIVRWNRRGEDGTIAEYSSLFDAVATEPVGGEFSKLEMAAVAFLLEYVGDRLQGLSAKPQPPIRWREAENMGIDANTMKGLEITETSREAISGGKGSLLHSIRRTVSNSGARLLRSRISSPSTSLATINQRLDLVQTFIDNKAEREVLVSHLKKTFDTQRLVQKFSLGRGDADDLVSLYRTIAATRNIKVMLEGFLERKPGDNDNERALASVNTMVQRISMKGPDALASRIAEAIDEEGLLEHHRHEEAQAAATLDIARSVMASEGSEDDLDSLPRTAKGKAAVTATRAADAAQLESWRMRKTANTVLAHLHAELDGLLEQRAALESELRDKLQAGSLSLRWTPGQGHICHVKGLKDVKSSMAHFPSARNAGTSKSTRSFYHSQWSTLGNTIDRQKLRILGEEENLFRELRDAVVLNLARLRRNAAVLDELDVACGSAVLAEEENLTRPNLDNSKGLHVVGGRHATVKQGLDEQGRAFVGNDCTVGHQDRVWLITGPNMAGKSTFLRQNALISILAQVGMFVPAAYAEIGIVDHVFSRIGSADNLYRDQSTFMVEMLESAHILRTATDRSLVIMDEIGRGTTPEDGTAVAFACLHHLYHVNRCRTLFATHFHALADRTAAWQHLSQYCTDVVPGAHGGFYYDYRLRRGVNRNSHALKVARLAGLPSAALDVAQSVLDGLRATPPSEPQRAAGTA